MDNLKDKYFMRFFLSTIGFMLDLICVILAIKYQFTIFLIIPLILIDLLFMATSYQSLMYRLALRDKFEVVHNTKLDLSEYYNKKLEKKNKALKILDRIFYVSLYASPIIIIISISLGVFLTNSVLLALVVPAFLIVYLLLLFFVKDIYSNYDYSDEKELKEEIIINKKSISYKGTTYIFNYCGFHFKGSTYKFLFIPLSKPKFDDETLKKIEELNNNEVCD